MKFLLMSGLMLHSLTGMAATFVVNFNVDDLSDPVPEDGVCEITANSGQCTLRAAIESANETPGGPHVVEIPYLAGQTYPVRASNSINAYNPMTIRGTGGGRPIIVGELFITGGMLRLSGAVLLEHVEIRPNTTMGNNTYGLSVSGENTVIVRDTTIIPGSGGTNVGVYVTGGTLSCNRCEIKDGQSLGIRVVNDGQLNLLHSRVTNNINTYANQGGGIWLTEGSLTITNSLVDNNQALGESPLFIGQGGGIYTEQNNTFLHVINSTISQNKANANGGGIFAQGNTRLENVTITQNRADFNDDGAGLGGGIYLNDFTVITAKNSIVHGNSLPCPQGVPLCFPAGRNCDDSQGGTIGLESLGWVMVGDDANCPLTDLTGETNYTSSAIPKLGPLTSLGGLHPVHPIINTGSEADGGDPDGCSYTSETQNGTVQVPLFSDQRGMQRPLNSDPNPFDGEACDIGAYEAKCFGDDPDGDYVGSSCDVCPAVFDPLQEDSNLDGIGDACSADLIFFSGFE